MLWLLLILKIVESCDSASLASVLLDLTLSASKNQKVQENCAKYLFLWWDRYQNVEPTDQQTIVIDGNREKLFLSLPLLMSSHSSSVKSYQRIEKLKIRAVVSFMKRQVQVFTREKVRSVLLAHNVSEFTMKEMLGEDVASEKSSQSSSSFQSFQSFRRAEKEKEKEKEKEGIKQSPSDVITVLLIVSSIEQDIVVIWRRQF